MNERPAQWIRTGEGDLINLSNADAIALSPYLDPDENERTALVAHFGEHEHRIADFSDLELADSALDALERMLPFAMISFELDILAPLIREARL